MYNMSSSNNIISKFKWVDKTKPIKLASIMLCWNALKQYLIAVLGVSTYSVDPGVVDTGITRHLRRPLASFMKSFGFLIRTPAEGAYTTIYCIVTPENQLHNGGHYRSGSRSSIGGSQDAEHQWWHTSLSSSQQLCCCAGLRRSSGRWHGLEAVGCQLPHAGHPLEMKMCKKTGLTKVQQCCNCCFNLKLVSVSLMMKVWQWINAVSREKGDFNGFFLMADLKVFFKANWKTLKKIKLAPIFCPFWFYYSLIFNLGELWNTTLTILLQTNLWKLYLNL